MISHDVGVVFTPNEEICVRVAGPTGAGTKVRVDVGRGAMMAACHTSCPQSLSELTTLDEPWRSFHNRAMSFPMKCDNQASLRGSHKARASWYRFEGEAGYRLATTSAGGRRCGTDRTGWLVTPHPAVGSPAAEGTVCFSSAQNNCTHAVRIHACVCQVVGTYELVYMYKLPTVPWCFLGYCGESDGDRGLPRRRCQHVRVPDAAQELASSTLPRGGCVTVILRGEPFRSTGCKVNVTDVPVKRQLDATASLFHHIVCPLANLGNNVRLVVTACHAVHDAHRGCRREALIQSLLLPSFQYDVSTLASWNSTCRSLTQRNAVSIALEQARQSPRQLGCKRDDLVILTRHDILWKMDIDRWPTANFSTVVFPSRLENESLFGDEGVNDVFISAPGELFASVADILPRCWARWKRPGEVHERDDRIQQGHYCGVKIKRELGVPISVATNWRPKKLGLRDAQNQHSPCPILEFASPFGLAPGPRQPSWTQGGSHTRTSSGLRSQPI